MSNIRRLQITDVRNLKQVSLSLSPINIFFGENGSGKTSILEAISLLGTGRSFRSHKTRSLIRHDQSALTIFATINVSGHTDSLGITKQINGHTSIRINGNDETTTSSLATKLPLQIISSKSFQLIEGSPQDRRKFLDWMTFHVKPEFINLWRRQQRLLKQRNSLLKHDKIDKLQISSWDEEFVQVAEEIHKLRHSVFSEFLDVLNEFSQGLEFALPEINYKPGWDTSLGLKEVLMKDLVRDMKDQYTHQGPQRADLTFSFGSRSASEVLSRGQEKSLIITLHIAQAKLFSLKAQSNCIFIIDDLLAELDQSRLRQLTQWLIESKHQVFITGIDKPHLQSLFSIKSEIDITMFHVKHGEVNPISEPIKSTQ